MNFWYNVDLLREYKGLTRKELAYQAQFSLSSFSTGIARNSFPSVDVAYRIAKVLNVSVEFLMTNHEEHVKTVDFRENIEISNFIKYKNILEDLEAVPQEPRKLIYALIKELKK